MAVLRAPLPFPFNISNQLHQNTRAPHRGSTLTSDKEMIIRNPESSRLMGIRYPTTHVLMELATPLTKCWKSQFQHNDYFVHVHASCATLISLLESSLVRILYARATYHFPFGLRVVPPSLSRASHHCPSPSKPELMSPSTLLFGELAMQALSRAAHRPDLCHHYYLSLSGHVSSGLHIRGASVAGCAPAVHSEFRILRN